MSNPTFSNTPKVHAGCPVVDDQDTFLKIWRPVELLCGAEVPLEDRSCGNSLPVPVNAHVDQRGARGRSSPRHLQARNKCFNFDYGRIHCVWLIVGMLFLHAKIARKYSCHQRGVRHQLRPIVGQPAEEGQAEAKQKVAETWKTHPT